ncbi:MAG: DUF2339 domain-containing protein, partial [Clostridia bacterium]|nr:DUF2339 domain-containing protein [Clostridia bacterium]
LVVLLVFNVFAFLSVSDIVLSFVRKGAGSLEFYPLFMGLYLLGIITSLLVVQVKSFVIADINVITSLVFLIFAFFYIIYGFNKHYSNMRRLGLGLSIFSTAKLFIFDLRFLDAVGRIISYFAFGLVLIGISLVYQRFKKSMEGLGKETQV